MFKRWVYLSPYSGRRSQKKSDKIPRPRLSPVPLTQARTKKGSSSSNSCTNSSSSVKAFPLWPQLGVLTVRYITSWRYVGIRWLVVADMNYWCVTQRGHYPPPALTSKSLKHTNVVEKPIGYGSCADVTFYFLNQSCQTRPTFISLVSARPGPPVCLHSLWL